MKCLIYLFLISASLFTFCRCRNDLTQGEKVFLQYAEHLNIKIPKENHNYILLSKQSCSGCQTFIYNLAANDISDTITYIYDKSVMDNNEWIAINNIIVDSEDIIGRLNWNYANVIEVYTSEGKIDSIKDYSSEELRSRFRY